METFTIKTLNDRLNALPAHVVYGQLTGREDWGQKMQELVPLHMRDGFIWWVALGRTDNLGGFMRAMLEGDLYGTFRKADGINAASMHDWMMFLHNYSPMGCYGSPERVAAWDGIIKADA